MAPELTQRARLLRLPVRPHQIVNSAFLLAFCLLLSMMISFVWIESLQKPGPAKLHEWILLSPVVALTALIYWMTYVAASRLLHECFPVAVYSDAESRKLILKNIPWFERSFRFEEISALLILKCTYKGSRWLWLCVEIKGRRRLLRLMEIKTSFPRAADDIQQIIMPIARSIAEKVQVPIKEESASALRSLWITSI